MQPNSRAVYVQHRPLSNNEEQVPFATRMWLDICFLFPVSDGVGFVQLKLKDQASVRQELRRMREGTVCIQVADDELATIDGAERAHAAAEVSRAGGEGGSSAGDTVGRQVASRRAAALVRPTVATSVVAVPSGFDRPTVAAIPVNVDEENERERWRLHLQQQQRDERASIDDVKQRSIDEVARALQSTVSANTLPLSASPPPPLLPTQVAVSTLQQLHQLQFQQQQYQHQQQQQQLMAQQQQQLQQHHHFMRDAQWLQLPPPGAAPLPHSSMSPTCFSASSLYSPFSSIPTQPLPLNLSDSSADYMQPTQPPLLQPTAAPSASLSLTHLSLLLGLPCFASAFYASTFPFVQPLGPPTRLPTLPPLQLPLDWPLLGLDGGHGASMENGSTGNDGGVNGGSEGYGGFSDHNAGNGGVGRYGKQSVSGGYGGYHQQ